MTFHGGGQFESSRLSRIAEEVDSLSFSSTDNNSSQETRSRDSTLDRVKFIRKESNVDYQDCSPPSGQGSLPTDIDGYCKPMDFLLDGLTKGELLEQDARARDALKYIKEKYDSLGKVKVKKPQLSSSLSSLTQECEGEFPSSATSQEDCSSALNIPVPALRVADYLESTCIDGKKIKRIPFQPSSCLPAGIVSEPNRLNATPVMSSNFLHKKADFPESARTRTASESVSPNTCQKQMTSKQSFHHSLTSQERMQVEMFYSSCTSFVYVCSCMASMYIGTPKSINCIPSDSLKSNSLIKSDWVFVKSGIPLFLLEIGQHKKKMRLFIVLAERGTGFTLWRDAIDHLSEYTENSTKFHTLYLSTDHTRIIGLLFDSEGPTTEFLKHFNRLASEAHGSVLNLGSETRTFNKNASSLQRSDNKKGKSQLKKSAISQPCCFVHITKLDGKGSVNPATVNGVISTNSSPALPQCTTAGIKNVRLRGSKK